MFSLKAKHFINCVDIPDDNKFTVPSRPCYNTLPSELEFFKRFFPDSLLSMIVEETNLYSVQVQGTSVNVTVEELEQFLGIEILMGIVKMPAYPDYWTNDLRFEKK